MYYIVFISLLFFSILEVASNKKYPVIFHVIYVVMTCMAAFRYGQLTDYFAYEYFYDNPIRIEKDAAFSYLLEFFRIHGLSYILFVIFSAVFTMGLSYPFLSIVCKYSFVSFLIYYVFIFLILSMSAVRQGMALAVLLLAFMFLLRERRVIYCILIILGSLLHLSLLAAIPIAFIYKRKIFNNEKIIYTAVGILTLFALVTPDLTEYLPSSFLDRSIGSYQDSRFTQILLRFLLILPVLYIKPPYNTLGYYARSIVITGYCMYCVFAFSSLIAGRLEFYYRIFLCLFASYLVSFLKINQLKKTILGMLIIIHIVLFFKNINSFISQGNYGNNITVLNFPYISIFDK